MTNATLQKLLDRKKNLHKTITINGDEYEIKAVQMDEFESIISQFDHKSAGNTGNEIKIMIALISEGLVKPEITGAALDELGVSSREAAIKSIFLPGEIMQLGNEVKNLSGFGAASAEEVAEAKN
ncbi:hypothetical protein JCM19037_1559 [Geomicrobium sp. JCM 19037]|uniref:phage tail assembly chaperone n=1 Tax=Geomicrobium sp. JCM 19037 TaxID=1460634 RepID=UPI00045F2F30|nr:hypothetical protein [Geomicrobium sp. JCM 19037]GAK03252.1 hypothetical protein JCM19037_1559 [Geomicrobium sp. JCM 19037]